MLNDREYDAIQHAKSIRQACYENCYNLVPTCTNGEQCRYCPKKDLR